MIFWFQCYEEITLKNAIEEMILKLKYVKSIIEKCRKLASASNQGMKFNQELKRQQALEMPTEKILELIQDVVTRYAFICYMFGKHFLTLVKISCACALYCGTFGCRRVSWPLCKSFDWCYNSNI